MKNSKPCSEPVRIINEIYNGDLNLAFVNQIDDSKWHQDYRKILQILRKLMEEKKELSCENVFKASDQKTVAQLMGILNKYDKEFNK